MRVLFTVQPLTGHYHSMVPLAQALNDHGHTVAFATGKRFGPLVKRAGFDFFPCGRDGAGSHNILTSLPEWPTIQAAISHPGNQQIWGFIQGFGPQMADDLINVMQDWKPDLIVRDPVDFGGYIAAEYFDVPYASILWALYISPYISPGDGHVEPINALGARHGLDPDPDSFDRYFVLNALPPSWELLLGAVPPPVTHRFCMPPYDLSVQQSLPDWIDQLSDRPTVYATFGTTFNKQPDRFQTLIDTLCAEDFNTIITVGQSMDPTQFHPLPANVKIERYIPQTLIFPHCDAVIFHGGYNSLHTTLWHGLPMVIMPLEAGDQLPTGQQCSDLGIGILVEGNPPEPDALRAAIKSVLDNPTYRQRAQHLQREMMALPDLSDAVQRLETLARTREPQLA